MSNDRPHLILRAAQRSEAEALDRIALAAKAHWGYSERQLAVWAAELRTAPQSIVQWPTCVAEAGRELLGFAQLDPTQSPWELVSLLVHPGHMGRGVGKQLLDWAIATAVRSGQDRLRIDADPNAAGFYLACGASRNGEVAAPIPGAPDRVRPQLELRTGRA